MHGCKSNNPRFRDGPLQITALESCNTNQNPELCWECTVFPEK